MKSTGVRVALLLCIICTVPLWSQPAAAPFKPALLVIDIQNAYLPMMDQQDVASGMEAINELIGVFREQNYPVILVYHQEIGQPLAPGDPAFEFPASVKILEGDPRVIKHQPSAFTKTNLDELLKAKGINSVYLCGLSATGCVLATYFGALDREYETVMVNEALISPKAEYTTMIRNITGAYHAWRGDRAVGAGSPRPYTDIPGFCKAATLEDVRGHGHVLTPGRYVGAEAVADDGEPFEEIMARLVETLRTQQAEGARLDAAIAANLEGLGYGE